MRHRNQDDWSRIRSQQHWAGGYTPFRYGTVAIRETHGSVDIRSRITLAGQKKPLPVLNRDKRKHIVQTLFDAMQDWRYSPFQYEGATRAQLRSALCAAGYGWERSDQEAALIVAEVLKGYPRPSYNEGQPSYTASIVTCKGCGGPLDEYEISNGIRFCCDECRRMSQNRAVGLSHGFIEVGPTECENPNCSEIFYPKDLFQRFCSRACYVEGRGLVLPKRDCSTCGKEFQPTHETSMYCSDLCHNRGRDRIRKERRHDARQERSCEFCRSRFTPKKATEKAKFCSTSCMKKAAYYRQKAAKASKAVAVDSNSPIMKLLDAA